MFCPPGLPLQEVLVKVQVSIADRQQTHTLHPHTSLLFTLYWHLLKAAEPKQLALLEVAAQRGGEGGQGRGEGEKILEAK